MASNVKQTVTSAVAEKAVPAHYNRDFYSWLMEQARHVRLGEWGAVDRDNLAEEIESWGATSSTNWKVPYACCSSISSNEITSQARDRGAGCCQ
jgi:hypothetical protein